jgi:hypothetical protein
VSLLLDHAGHVTPAADLQGTSVRAHHTQQACSLRPRTMLSSTYETC